MPVKKSERVQEIPLSELHPFKIIPSGWWMMKPCSVQWKA